MASAEPFLSARGEILRRRREGLHAEMQFTFRNPERSTDPGRILEGACSLVVGALAVPAPRLPPSRPGRARVAAYARRDLYSDLRAALSGIARRLEAGSWKARVVADDNALVDRAAAVRAGIGWQGRNGNVLLPGRGSWFVFGSVVTDAPLVPDEPVDQDGCGNCRRCVDSCPTGAILADGVVDARRCLAWLVQAPGPIPPAYREAVGWRLYGCDDCQEVCPVGLPDRSRGPDDAADTEALGLLRSTDTELLERYGHWYIAERAPRHLRRNALVVLGNTADGSAEGVEEALLEHIRGDDPMLAEHAGWAATALGRHDLLGSGTEGGAVGVPGGPA